jgi:TetR/AcrR family transcriptional regulator, transcriptional repressor for nem operon
MAKGELTRQRILEAAAPIFNRRGFSGCSMQDVMEATGLEKGGLYRHFSSKEELAVEALKFALSRSMRTRTDDLGHIESPLAKLRFAVKRFIETPSIMPGGCPLMNAAIDSDDGNPALRQVAQEAFLGWKTRLSAIVEAGMQCGEIRKEIKPLRVANTMIATLEGALMMSRIEDTQEPLLDAQSTIEALLDGIAVKAGELGA